MAVGHAKAMENRRG